MNDSSGGISLSAADAERLAEAAHEVFCAALRARGYVYGPTTDDVRRIHSALRPFAELTEHDQEQNRELARSIPAKLGAAGFAIVPANDEGGATPFSRELLERLAEDEHARWVRAKLTDGWRHAPETDKERKQHASLLRWCLEKDRRERIGDVSTALFLIKAMRDEPATLGQPTARRPAARVEAHRL